MGLFSFIKGEFLEVVHWEDNTQDTMVYKFPMEDKQQIKEGAQLIVRPSQVAVFVYEGQIADIYQPGKYELQTDTMPIFTSLSNWKFKFENHFKTDVYFINSHQFTNQKWGTINPIMMRDVDFGILRLRGFGVYSFRVSEPTVFLKEVFGSNRFFTVDQINEYLKSLIVSTVSDVIAEAGIPALDLATQYDEIGQRAMARIMDRFSAYGLAISDFAVENLSLPESVEQAIDKRTQMGALGNLDQYMKYQTAEAVRDAAQNPGGGFAGIGAGIGAGTGIGRAMTDAMNTPPPTAAAPPPQATTPTPSPAPVGDSMSCPNCHASIPKGSKFCPECGSGMQKKCTGCGHDLPVNAKFCPECGQSQN